MLDYGDAGSSAVPSRRSSRPEEAELGPGETQRADGVWSEFTCVHQIHAAALSPGWRMEITSTQVAVLSRDLQDKESLLSTGSRSSAETEEMLATVDSITAERDQLKIDLHENIEMVGEPTLPPPQPNLYQLSVRSSYVLPLRYLAFHYLDDWESGWAEVDLGQESRAEGADQSAGG